MGLLHPAFRAAPGWRGRYAGFLRRAPSRGPGWPRLDGWRRFADFGDFDRSRTRIVGHIRHHGVVARDLHAALASTRASGCPQRRPAGIVRRREAALPVVVRIDFPQRVGRARLARGAAQPQIRPRFLARLDPDAETRMLSVCACCSGWMASSPTRTNSRPDSFLHDWITWLSALLIQALSGMMPSCVACRRKVSVVARFTWLTKGEAGAEKSVADDSRQPLVYMSSSGGSGWVSSRRPA